MELFGVSLSAKQCRSFDIDSADCLRWLIDDCGFRRFRLMSYWDEVEARPGKYDFKELDRQIETISQAGGTVSLCLGARQPRWPENHWPDWAWQLSRSRRTEALLRFIKTVVKRYRKYECIVSYQLENEALLDNFGLKPDINRVRLRQEFELVKKLDPKRPIVMTTSTSWGIPLRPPIPDIVGFSYYQVLFNIQRQDYTKAFHKVWLQKLKHRLIKLIWHKPSFIHELQLEPWGPKNIWEMSWQEQMKSMSPEIIRQNVKLARKTKLKPIDLWGAEWWFWCLKKQNKPNIYKAVLEALGE